MEKLKTNIINIVKLLIVATVINLLQHGLLPEKILYNIAIILTGSTLINLLGVKFMIR